MKGFLSIYLHKGARWAPLGLHLDCILWFLGVLCLPKTRGSMTSEFLKSRLSSVGVLGPHKGRLWCTFWLLFGTNGAPFWVLWHNLGTVGPPFGSIWLLFGLWGAKRGPKVCPMTPIWAFWGCPWHRGCLWTYVSTPAVVT